MAVTPNLGLYLPDENDYVSNERDLNDNFEKIDSAVAKESDRNVLNAPERTVLSNALLIDNPSYKDGWNRPWRVSANSGTIYLPSNCAWGIREVLPSTSGHLQVRITGCTTDGKSSMWTNCLANGTWTGWVEYASLTPTVYTGTKNDSYIGAIEGRVTKSGHVVSGFFVITMNNNLNDNSIAIITNIPKAYYGYVQLPMIVLSGPNTGKVGRASVRVSGAITMWYSSFSMGNGESFLIPVNYICE